MVRHITPGGRKPAVRPLTVLDLFAGCGGLSTGLRQAGGFRVVIAGEWDSAAAATYRLNHPGVTMVEKNIALENTRREICAAFDGMQCDVVAGGIPCQCFSHSGKRDPNDPRIRLYEPFIDCVSRLAPSVVVIENVRCILSMRHNDGTVVADRIATLLRGLGYAVGYWILTASDFGVAQRRVRTFIFGWCRGTYPRLRQTHDKHGRNGLPKWLTVHDAIGDLEQMGEDNAWSHVFTKHGPGYLGLIRRTPIGGKAVTSYNEGGVRNPPDRPSVTLKTAAWPVHYLHDRVITPREGARLQGFPDDFLFAGNKSEVTLQIGNAVPPPLAKAVGIAVMGMLGVPDAG